MENTETSPKEVCILVDAVFGVLIQQRDVEAFNLMQTVLKEILRRSQESMDEVLRRN